jgi:DNA polymerase-3 subunit alpha
MSQMPVLDTCTEVNFVTKLPGRGGRFKLPTLTELHSFFFNKGFGKRITRPPMLRLRRVVSWN